MDTYGHVGWQINSTKNHKHKPQRAKRRSPSQICASPSSRETKQKANGAGPTKTTTIKICHGHSEKPLCRNSQKDAPNELVAPRKVKHAFLIVVADRQQRKGLPVHYCILASQSPHTSFCSGVQFKTNERWVRSRKSKLLATRLQLYRPPLQGAAPWQWLEQSQRQGR